MPLNPQVTQQQLNVIELDCTNWYKVSLAVYENLITTLEMQEMNEKAKECDHKSVKLRASLRTLTLNAQRNACKKNDTLVQKVRELRVAQQDYQTSRWSSASQWLEIYNRRINKNASTK